MTDDAVLRYLLPLSGQDIRRLVEKTLAQPCPQCGGAVQKQRLPGCDLDIVCAKGCGWTFPIDTGPFSLGRRVD